MMQDSVELDVFDSMYLQFYRIFPQKTAYYSAQMYHIQYLNINTMYKFVDVYSARFHFSYTFFFFFNVSADMTKQLINTFNGIK